MKVVCFGDIHFGCHSNSDIFNQQCLDFLDFTLKWTDEHLQGEFITIFLGDYYHTRNTINTKTLNYGSEGLITLNNLGLKQYVLLGNHDLYYNDKRDIHSMVACEKFDGMELITEPLMVDNLLLCPWLTKDETLKGLIEENSPDYVFGHFEIPSFHFNSKIIMPGEYNPFDYDGPKRIISGHFHTRDEKNNISYIGNCFSHDFSDSNNWHNKGFAVLDTETNTIEYVEWPDAPKYLVSSISNLEKAQIPSNLHLRLINDTDLDNEVITKLQEELVETGNIVECQVLPKELNLEAEVESVEMSDIGNMNIIIPDMLQKVEMEGIEPKKLIDIYNNLDI